MKPLIRSGLGWMVFFLPLSVGWLAISTAIGVENEFWSPLIMLALAPLSLLILWFLVYRKANLS